MASPRPCPLWCCVRLAPTSLEGSLGEPPKLAGPNRPAGVGDREQGAPSLCARCELDSAAGNVVPGRVRDEIGGELEEEVWVAARFRRLESDDGLEAARVVARRAAAAIVARSIGSWRASARPPHARSRSSAIRRCCCVQLTRTRSPISAQCGQVRVRVCERDLDQCSLEGDRCAQLVRDQGRKAVPALECGRACSADGVPRCGRGADGELVHGPDGRWP